MKVFVEWMFKEMKEKYGSMQKKKEVEVKNVEKKLDITERIIKKKDAVERKEPLPSLEEQIKADQG